MTDRERAIAALELAGFVQAPDDPNLYISPTGSAILHDRINGVELWETQARIANLLSPLTLEDVERACEAAFKALPSTTDPSHFAAIRAYWLDVMERLRQQVKGLEKIKVHPNDVEQRLREIEERANRATPGPWRAICEATAEETACGRDVYSLIGPEWVEEGDYSFFGEHDAQFIAHAREDVPWLLSLLREKERGAV